MLSISDISWLFSNNFRKSEISLEAVNLQWAVCWKKCLHLLPKHGPCQLMGIDIPYHLLCYLRPPLPPCSLGEMQAFLIILPCMVRHLELQKLKNSSEQKQVLAVFVPWLNEWGKRTFIRAGDGLRKLPCWTYEETNENLFQLLLWHRPASSKVSSLLLLRKANFYLNKSFYLNNKLLSTKMSLEELEKTDSILCLQQPFRCDHHPSQFTNWEAERSAEFPTPYDIFQSPLRHGCLLPSLSFSLLVSERYNLSRSPMALLNSSGLPILSLSLNLFSSISRIFFSKSHPASSKGNKGKLQHIHQIHSLLQLQQQLSLQ